PHPALARNRLAPFKTQVKLGDADLWYSQLTRVAAENRSTKPSGANRHPSHSEVFRLRRLVRPALRGAARVLRGAAEMLRPLAAEPGRAHCRWKVVPAFRHQPFGRCCGASAPNPMAAKSTA